MKKKKHTKPHRAKRPASTAIVPVAATKSSITKEVPRLPEKIEQSLIGGNLVNLSPEERVSLYMATCKSLRLNHLTNPFCYILVADWENDTEKLILYAAKNCTDQLRQIHGVAVIPNSLRQWREDGMLKASVSVTTRNGRTDSDIGVIPLKRWSKKKREVYELTGAALANAEMHVVTKAKRRATLSVCGLGGIVDESELDTMNVIGGVTKEGRIWRNQSEEAETREAQEEASRQTIKEKLQAMGRWCEKHKGDTKNCPADEHSAGELEQMEEAEKDAKPTNRNWKPSAEKDTAKPVESEKSAGKGTSAPSQGIVEAIHGANGDVQLMGDLANLTGMLQEHCKAEWGKDSFWHIKADAMPILQEMCRQLGFRLIETFPKTSGSGKATPETKPGRGSAAPAVGSERPPAKQEPSAPTLVKGIIKQAEPSTGGRPRVNVLLRVEAEKKEYWMSTFQQKLFDPLLSMKSKGKEAALRVEKREKDGKTYLNIVGADRIGPFQFDDDGVTPVIDNRTREAGSLFK
jgi:hypothetical protein